MNANLHPTTLTTPDHFTDSMSSLPLVTLITPAYNEASIIQGNIRKLRDFMHGLADEYRFEILIVNDGSIDGTKELADGLADEIAEVRVVHHKINRNLGVAMQTGFRHAKGDYVIVLDIDLSYSPEEHIERLLTEIIETDSDIVLASPYMKGGKSTDVPFMRLLMSKTVNRIMRFSAGKDIHTFTSMVRVYKGDFLRHLNLKSSTYDINPEIIHKSIILRAKMAEIPAHLDWSFQKDAVGRTSSMRVIKGILGGLMTGFIFRPYMFFMLIGLLLFLAGTYVVGWIFMHTFQIMPSMELLDGMYNTRFSAAVAEVFNRRPHAFFVGGFALIIALQFLGIGFLSLQSKRYFDELFHLGSTINKQNRR